MLYLCQVSSSYLSPFRGFGPIEKYWLKSFIMALPLAFLINSVSSLLTTIKTVRCFWPVYSKNIPSVKPKLKLTIGVD